MWTETVDGWSSDNATEAQAFFKTLVGPGDKNKKKDDQQKQNDATIHNIIGGPIGANMTEKERAEYNKENAWGLAAYAAGEGLGYILKPVFRPIAAWFGKLFSSAIDWTSVSNAPLVGDLANAIDAELGNGTVSAVERPYSGSFGEGDIDIALKKANIEVKSGGKMKITQQLKNLSQASSEGKRFFLYMPEATTPQIKEAARSGIIVIKNQYELFNTLKKIN
jgi:hypothetical protein